MNIQILNPSFELQGEIDNHDSLLWVRRWHKAGQATITISANAKHADKLVRGNIIIHGDKSAIITGTSLNIEETATGTETLTVSAEECACICNRRIIIPPVGNEHDNQSGNAETVMKNYVDNTFAGLTDFVTATDLGRGDSTTWSATYDNLADFLEQISINTGMGWGVYVDRTNKRFVFEVYEGVNRGEGSGNPVIFRPDYDNIKTQKYTENDETYRNVAYVAGQGEGVDRVIETVGTQAGLERREVFVDARDIKVDSELATRGEQKLTEYPLVQTFECQILDRPNRKYGTDWDLGDIVTVANVKWGVSMDARIVEVPEEETHTGTNIYATFGTGKILLADAVKRVTSQSDRALRVTGGDENDYFAPTIAGSTTVGNVTYTTQYGKYIKRGDEVSAWAIIKINTITTVPTGNLLIKGLPHASVNDAGFRGIGTANVYGVNWGTNKTQLTTYMGYNVKYVMLFGTQNDSTAHIVNCTDISAGDEIYISINYPTR